MGLIGILLFGAFCFYCGYRLGEMMKHDPEDRM
jgi:hypothetical protein